MRQPQHLAPPPPDRGSLPVGTEINVDGYLAKDGENNANGRDVTLSDGKKVFLGSSNPDADASAYRSMRA